MRGKLVLLAMVGVMTAGLARADGLNVIEVRQAGQDLLSADFSGIRAVVAAKGDVKTLENPAKYMARWIKVFPTLFPKGSEQGGGTKALPAIWSDTAGFQKIATEAGEASLKHAIAWSQISPAPFTKWPINYNTTKLAEKSAARVHGRTLASETERGSLDGNQSRQHRKDDDLAVWPFRDDRA